MVTTLVKNLSFEEYLNYDDGLGLKYQLVDVLSDQALANNEFFFFHNRCCF